MTKFIVGILVAILASSAISIGVSSVFLGGGLGAQRRHRSNRSAGTNRPDWTTGCTRPYRDNRTDGSAGLNARTIAASTSLFFSASMFSCAIEPLIEL